MVSDMNEKDWNVADGYAPHDRLYIKQDPRVRVVIDDEPVWIPTEMLEGAYVLDNDCGDDATLVRIPKCGNVRGYVDTNDIVFFTLNSDKTYVDRLEIGNAFRYQDSSSHDEEIVPEAPEWLNNICNRIDALEAQVEMLEPENFRNLVMSLLESPAFAHMVFNTVRQQSIRYQNSQKTLKELWDANTPLYYRDKGWR
jgi:hypothetical protein